MTRKPRAANQGTVVNRIKDTKVLSQWAQEIAQTEVFQKAGVVQDALQKSWEAHLGKLNFFTANNPKNSQLAGFEDQYGLLLFSDHSATQFLQSLLGISAQLPSDGGLIALAFAREGHKSLMKYMLLAAERFVHEKQMQVFCFVFEHDASLARFVKSSGYEEILKVESTTYSALKGTLFSKVLTS